MEPTNQVKSCPIEMRVCKTTSCIAYVNKVPIHGLVFLAPLSFSPYQAHLRSMLPGVPASLP